VAKKARTPPPPRKVQAPRQRTEQRGGLSDRQKLWILSGVAGLGIVGVALAVVLFATAGGGGADDKGIAQALAKAGCTYHVYQATSQRHVTSVNSKVKYNSFPASNGAHYFRPAPWGSYSDPVPQVVAVHNLEHGGMLIEYGPKVSTSDKDAIDAFYSADRNGMLVFPYPALGKRIAFVAWTADLDRLSSNRAKGYHGEGRVAICTRFDGDAAKAFQHAFRAKGPERFPLDALKPGD
jgi:Protein of unknown function (DUF3105)